MFDLFRRAPLWNAPDGGAGTTPPAGDTPPAVVTPPAGDTPPATSKWFEASDYSEDERRWLTAKGMAEDDPIKALQKAVKGHRSAEQRIGKGIESIIDKPAKDQPLPEWLRAHAADLGLPDKEDGYAVERPDFWPKDAPWDDALEAEARKIAFDQGMTPSAYKGMVDLFAKKMADMDTASATGITQAKDKMMTELEKDFGQQTSAKITLARQAADVLGAKAGLTPDGILAISQTLAEKVGDAGVIRIFAAAGELMGEDQAVGLGRGGSLTMTPAEARQELAAMTAPGSDYYKATQAGDTAKLASLKPRYAQLNKIASGGAG